MRIDSQFLSIATLQFAVVTGLRVYFYIPRCKLGYKVRRRMLLVTVTLDVAAGAAVAWGDQGAVDEGTSYLRGLAGLELATLL